MTTVPPLGSAYWTATFGFTSFAEFQAATSPLLDLGLPHVGFIDTPLQALAWADPLSVTGTYLTAALVAAGYNDPNPSQPANVVVNSLNPILGSFAQQQESAVAGLIIPNCFQVTIQGVAGGHPIDNVIGVENASGTAAGAAAAVKTAWEIAAGPLAELANLYAMTNYHAVDISSSTGTIADLASTTTGGRAVSFSTRAACALIKWNGSSRSRSTRGRLYYGPISEGDINADGSTVASASVTLFNTAFTNFRNSLATAGYPLVVLSRKELIATVVTSQAVESTIATQRRRIRT